MGKWVSGCLLWLSLTTLAWAEQPGPPEPVSPDLPEAIVLAQNYMDALTNRDYSRLSRFYDRETEWYDRTAGKKLTGRRDIITFLRRVHSYTQEYYFVSDHTFYNGSLVVMIGSYYYKARGDLFGYPGKSITFSLPGVTTLKLDMENQRVDEHLDLLDYATMKDQLKMTYSELY
ncbi:nuclear transport factor 2 family protein [Ferrimonas marina]|uniref:SnoaL-like domain-containing protein n=1 Tax=Ferrimonas marina TaxID=299255 RepID=A0A1M5X1N9_9GAMM|nr:nuclear transport factor 2 family protein [Ferrimonas marina]SHH93806.1 SnoaL-like domain-containing protein [Ferrimonas marina]